MSKLRQLRKERKIAAKDLSARLGYSHPSGYYNLESGRTKTKLGQAKELAKVFGVPMEELLEE